MRKRVYWWFAHYNILQKNWYFIICLIILLIYTFCISVNTINQVSLLRIFSYKIHRLLKIKEQENEVNNLETLINNSRPPIFWKEKPLIKKQLSIWSLVDLKAIINEINNTEILCKKNPQISQIVAFKFFNELCKKANSYS